MAEGRRKPVGIGFLTACGNRTFTGSNSMERDASAHIVLHAAVDFTVDFTAELGELPFPTAG